MFGIIDFDYAEKFNKDNLPKVWGTPGYTFSSLQLTPYEDLRKFLFLLSLVAGSSKNI
jgi:hypothetical protein